MSIMKSSNPNIYFILRKGTNMYDAKKTFYASIYCLHMPNMYLSVIGADSRDNIHTLCPIKKRKKKMTSTKPQDKVTVSSNNSSSVAVFHDFYLQH